jgi:PKD repeat protein
VPPANQPPVAAFTSSVGDLKVSVDGSGSSDSDGTVVSYAWTFGDGATGSGVADSHTYAAAGTYSVKLTVTDDGGATDSVTKSVTVTAPVGTTFAKDAFSRTSASGWGSADTGGVWSVSSASSFSTDGSSGVVRVAAGATRQASLNGVSAKDVSIVSDLSLDQAPVGGNYYHQVLARVVGSTTYYSLTSRLESTGILRVYVSRMVSGTETILKTTVVSGFNYVAGEKLKVRFDVSGDGTTTLAGRVWRSGDSEPASPTVTTTDTTVSLQAAGAVSLKFYAGSTMTSVPLTIKVGDYSAEAK